MTSRNELDPFEIASQQIAFDYNFNRKPNREDRYKPRYNNQDARGGRGGVGANQTNSLQYEQTTAQSRSQSAAPRRQRRSDLDSDLAPSGQNIYLTNTDAERPPWLQYAIQHSEKPLDDEDGGYVKRPQRKTVPKSCGGRPFKFEDFDDEGMVEQPQARKGGRTMRDVDYEAITGIPCLGDNYKPRGLMRKSEQLQQGKTAVGNAPHYFTLTAEDLPPPDQEHPCGTKKNVVPLYESLSRDPQTGLLRTRIEVYELQEQRRGLELARQGKINDSTLDRFYHNKEVKPEENILWPWSKYYSWNCRRRPIVRPNFGEGGE